MQRRSSRRKPGPVVLPEQSWLAINRYRFEKSYRERARALLAYRLAFGGPHPGPFDPGAMEILNKFLDTVSYPADMLDYEGMT